jgi:4-amino-4-deoxy-L-arabinose transferase-like glycosyltransferase
MVLFGSQFFSKYQAIAMSDSQRHLLLLGIVLCAVFVINLFFPRDLWVQDEARYGEIVREMLTDGHWLVPYLNGHAYPDKPPLYFWLVIFLGWIVGHGEWAFRLLSVLGTALAAAGVYALGRDMLGREAGLWAALFFLSAFLSLVVGQIARMDMLLAAAAVWAWWSLYRYADSTQRGEKPGISHAKPGRFLAAFWGLSVLGVMVKGPIALLFTLLPAIAWFVWEHGWAGCRRLRCLAGLGGLLALAALWAWGVYQLGHQAYLEDIWHKQLVGRAVNSWSQKQPVYFYLLLLPLLLMPWISLIAHGAWQIWRDKPACWRGLAAFTLVPLIGLSLVSGKLFIYLQPLLPGLCLAGAYAAARLDRASKPSPWISWPPIFFILLLGLSLGYGALRYLHLETWQAAAGGGALAGLLLAGIRAAWLPGWRWLWQWAGITAALSWLIFGALIQPLNPLFSGKPLGQAVVRLAPAETPLAVVNTTRGILNYYAGRLMQEIPLEAVPGWLREHPGGLLIIKQDDRAQAFSQVDPAQACAIMENYTVELKTYHVLKDCRL